MEKYTELLKKWIHQEPKMLEHLQMVRKLNLPQCFISAGYIRNFIWDTLHGYTQRTTLNDVDVVYFDQKNVDETKDFMVERLLSTWDSRMNWQVRNQARMHFRNGHSPYHSVMDAMSYWPETATAVGVAISDTGQLDFVAPYGLNDLFQLILRKSPNCQHEKLFYDRINKKHWLDQWPKLKVYKEELI